MQVDWPVLAGLAVVVILQIAVYRRLKGPKIRKGDLILYNNPHEDDHLNNMITHVLNVFPQHGTLLIHGRGDCLKGSTTVVVAAKHVQRLKVSPHHAFQLPGEPTETKWRDGVNEATWLQVPLSWFTYEYKSTKRAA
jgi:hypothetical protein